MPSTRPQGGPSATPHHASASAALGASLGASDGSGPDGSGPDGSGGFGSGDFGPGVPPAALRDQVRADFQRLNRNRRWMLSIFCGLCAAALAMVALVHPGHPGHGTDATGLIIGLQAASGALLVSAAFGWPSLGRLGLLRIVGAVALFGTALLVPLIDHGSPWSRADWHTGLHCLVHGAGTALTLSVAVVLVAGRLLRNHAR